MMYSNIHTDYMATTAYPKLPLEHSLILQNKYKIRCTSVHLTILSTSYYSLFLPAEMSVLVHVVEFSMPNYDYTP